MWVACGQYKELSIEDVKDEIIDIIQPTDPFKITIKDLIVSLPQGSSSGLRLKFDSTRWQHGLC